MKQSLALTDSKGNTVFLGEMMAEESSIPQVLAIAQLARRFAQIRSHLMSLLPIKPHRAPRTFIIMQPRESIFFKTMQPILDCSRTVSKKLCNLIAANPRANHKNCVKPMVIPGFFRSLDFLLYSNFNDVRILNLKLAHNASLPASIVAEKTAMRN
jgi:hypothetical protein